MAFHFLYLDPPEFMYPHMILNRSQLDPENTAKPKEFDTLHLSTRYDGHVHCTFCRTVRQLRGDARAPGLRAEILDAHKPVSHPFCKTCRRDEHRQPRAQAATQRNAELTNPTRDDEQPDLQALTGNSEQDVDYLIQLWTQPTKATLEENRALGFYPRYTYGCITSLVLTGGRTADYYQSNRRNYPDNTRVAFRDPTGRLEPYSLSDYQTTTIGRYQKD
jgi:hypothetical protein